jgi:hypothetical protein
MFLGYSKRDWALIASGSNTAIAAMWLGEGAFGLGTLHFVLGIGCLMLADRWERS